MKFFTTAVFTAGALFALTHGHWITAAIVVLIASPIAMAALAVMCEKRTWRQFASLKDQSWSFLLGDTFAIAPAMAFATLGWQTMPTEGWHASFWWYLASILIGGVAGFTFHFMDGVEYRKRGAEAQLSSWTKIWHDTATYPVLFGGMVYAGAPLLFVQWNHWGWGAVAGILTWGALAFRDSRAGLDPHKMHPPH